MKIKSYVNAILIALFAFPLTSCMEIGGTESYQSSENHSIVITERDEKRMTPYSVTLSLLLDDTDDNFNDYGVTWYVANDGTNEKYGGENFVELVEKRNEATADTVDFTNAIQIAARRNKHSSYTYFQADIRNLESGVEYFWRCGNGLGVYGEVGTISVPKAGRTEFTFTHVSDSQNSDGIAPTDYYHKAIAFAKEASPDFAVHTGDMVQLGRADGLWQDMLDTADLRTLPVMPVAGNHDYWEAYGCKDGVNETYRHYNITLPQQNTENGTYYSFDYQNCHFVMLNSGDIDTERWESQLAWLKEDLASNTAKWTILSIHEPFYSLGKYGFQQENEHYNVDQIRESLLPIIEGKVDLVLQGHDHMVQYTYPLKGGTAQSAQGTEIEIDGVLTKRYSLNGGVVYLMSGASGDQNRNRGLSPDVTSEFKDLFAYFMAADETAETYHREGGSFSNITVSEGEITVRTYGYLPDSDKAELITLVSFQK